jgi:hypothetical protein
MSLLNAPGVPVRPWTLRMALCETIALPDSTGVDPAHSIAATRAAEQACRLHRLADGANTQRIGADPDMYPTLEVSGRHARIVRDELARK